MSGMVHTHRRTVLWRAALVHRLSGIALALFLPLHFLVLALALRGAGTMDGFLRLTQLPLVKFAEGGLIFLLVVHFLGGLRLLALETLPWFGRQREVAIGAAMLAGVAALVFLVRVFGGA